MKNTLLPYFLELEDLSKGDRYNITKKRLLKILKDGRFVKKPLSFIPVDWNLCSDDWEEDVPYFFKNKVLLLKWTLTYHFAEKYLKGFALSNLIFKKLSPKCIIELKKEVYGKCCRKVTISPKKVSQHLYKIILTIPIDDKKQIRNLKVEEGIASLKGLKYEPFNSPKGILVNRKKMLEWASRPSISPKLEQCVDSILRKSIDTKPTQINNYFTDTLKCTSALKGLNKHFESINSEDFINLFILTYFDFLIEPPKKGGLIYIPAKCFLIEGTEESSGGFHFHYASSKYFDAANLLLIASNWFKEYSINDWAKKSKKEILKHGTRVAVAALMGRCMSHNVGSHALYHLEQKETGSRERAVFYSYLRERMDFVAATATQVPICSRTIKIEELIDKITNNTLLLQNIAEEVRQVKINCNEGKKLEVAIPGGIIGAQAFYLILENIIRDGAKYGSKSFPRMCLSVKASELNDEELEELTKYANGPAQKTGKDDKTVKEKIKANFLKITVSDDWSAVSENGEKNSLDRRINNDIEEIETSGLCSEKGELLPGAWGIKERYIAATFLRGESVEEIPLEDIKPCPPILRVEKNCDGNLAWVFYLLKPKEALIIRNETAQDMIHDQIRQRVEVKNWDEFKEEISRASACLRSKFVVLYPKTNEHLNILQENLPYLPYRILICTENLKESLSRKLHGKHCLVNQFKLGSESLLLNIYREWVDFLRKSKGLKDQIQVDFYLRKEGEPETFGHWWFDNNSNVHPVRGNIKNQNRPKFRVVIDRHASNAADIFDNGRLRQNVIHYEHHDGGTALRRFVEDCNRSCDELRQKELILGIVEAAVIRILVIDERLDLHIDKKVNFNKDTISLRDLLYAKGIVVKGKEYAAKSVVPKARCLIKWAESDGRFSRINAKRPFDYVLLHQGVADKIHRTWAREKGKVEFLKGIVEQIKNKGVRDVIIHSGRGQQELPEQVKFLGFSNIEDWIMRQASKYDIIHELMSLRKTKRVKMEGT